MYKNCFNQIKNILWSITALILMFWFLPVDTALAASQLSNEKIVRLEEKISKGYSNKFCNAIGMGVSKEGALQLSINENSSPSFNPSLWFDLVRKGEKEFEYINNRRVAELASNQIFNICGEAIMINNKEEKISFKEKLLEAIETQKAQKD